MAEVPACPSDHRLEQYLSGRLADQDVEHLERHLLQCDFCLQRAIAGKADNGMVRALHARAAAASGCEKDAVMAWILERLRPLQSSVKIEALRGDVTMAASLAGRPIDRTSANAGPSLAGSPEFRSLPSASAVPPPGLAFMLSPAQGPDEMGRLGPYRILDILGRGGMGIVFRAEDATLKRQVAVKALLPMVMGDNEARQRFLREAQATAVIENDHVIPIYEVGEERGVPYLVMPFLKGEMLDDWLVPGRTITVAQVLRLGQEIAAGLAAAHEKGLIHRDIKPSNIWLEAPTARVKILDFGLAQSVGENLHLTQTGYVVGTPAYMSPEQARAVKVDHRCDLFSLGAVLYRVSTGELPFKGDTPMALMTSLALDTPAPPAFLNPELPRAFSELVLQLLAKDPAQRPQSAQEVVERIEVIKRNPAGDPTSANPRPGLPGVEVMPAKATAAPRSMLSSPADGASSPSVTTRLRRRVYNQARQRRVQSMLLVGLLVACIVIAISTVIWFFNSSSQVASETRPSLASKSPEKVTSSLPAPAEGKLPVKVFLLAGQNDMGGTGHIRTLDWLGQDPKYGSLLTKIRNKDGTWAVRDRVWVYYPRDPGMKKQGKLTVGFGRQDFEIGPELLFGQVLGDSFPNSLLFVKVTHGNWSLAVEGRPPSSDGTTGPYYRQMIQTVRDTLLNLKRYCPDYEDQGCEIAGFVWFQGWNDMIFPDRLSQYENNLVNLIRDVRKDLGAPNLPVVVGEMGVQGNQPEPTIAAMREAKAAAVDRREFKGNVVLVRTSAYWDEQASVLMRQGFDRVSRKWIDDQKRQQFETMGSQEEFLYLGSGKIFALIGQGFGEAMKGMCPRTR